MTDLDLDAIEARAAAATDGPWEVHPDDADLVWLPGRGYFLCEMLTAAETNGSFIAHARTDVPALVAEVRRLRAIEQSRADAMTFADEVDPLIEESLRDPEFRAAYENETKRRKRWWAASWARGEDG
jgi:hypothetical protein